MRRFFLFYGMLCHSGSGYAQDVSCPGCWWIPGAVPLSSRKNAKGGEQGTQLACGSNKCPLPSNAFSRKPRGSHAPEIRHPGQEMVLRWGMEGARGKGRDPAMGSEKNGQLCRKCGKVCYDENGRIQYTVTLPIGEKVQIPRGTKLEISVDSIDYGYETYDPYVTSYLKIFMLFKMERTILKSLSMKVTVFGPIGRLTRTVRFMLTLWLFWMQRV